MKKIFIAAVIASLFTGCSVKTVPIPNSGANLRGKSITYVKKSSPKRPYFYTDSNVIGNAVGGFIGGLIEGAGDSKKYSATYEVPSNQLAQRLTPIIASKYGMQYASNANLKNSVDYILDVDTGGWMMQHITLLRDTARFIMRNDVKLKNAKTDRTVAQVMCLYKKEWKDNVPKYEDILANNHQFVKNYTQKAIDECIRKVQTQMLK